MRVSERTLVGVRLQACASRDLYSVLALHHKLIWVFWTTPVPTHYLVGETRFKWVGPALHLINFSGFGPKYAFRVRSYEQDTS